ncbi:hypothetical protein ACFX14_025442 [Malus domestica]
MPSWSPPWTAAEHSSFSRGACAPRADHDMYPRAAHAPIMELGLGPSCWIGSGSDLLGSADFWFGLGLGLMGYGIVPGYWIRFGPILDCGLGRPG